MSDGGRVSPSSASSSSRGRARCAAGLALSLLALGAGAYVAAITGGAFEIDADTLARRYALPESRFVEIGPARVHYVDEGRGPPLVLVHAPYMSLRAWDHAAATFADRFRVIRHDMHGSGLTTLDPALGYTIGDMVDTLDRLLDRLGVKGATVVGSSSGALVAYQLSLRHPERVSRLVLISPTGMPRTQATDPNRPRGNVFAEWLTHRHRSRAFWRDGLEMLYTSEVPVPETLVEQMYDMNRLEGRTEQYYRNRRNYQSGDPQAALGQLRVPTLVIWGLDNLLTSHLEGDVVVHWLENAPSLLIKYPRLGLYPELEAPDRVEADVAAFALGGYDERLRVTRRLPPADVAALAQAR